jgi:hypothetical protein
MASASILQFHIYYMAAIGQFKNMGEKIKEMSTEDSLEKNIEKIAGNTRGALCEDHFCR